MKKHRNRRPHPGDLIVISDIHSQLGLFRKFQRWITGSNARVVFLGDLIDRGSSKNADFLVLQTVHAMHQNPSDFGLQSVDCLKGNHELMFLQAAQTGNTDLWCYNGGNLADLPRLSQFASWIATFPLYKIVDNVLLSHAGTFSGIDPAEYVGDPESEEAFVWNRQAAFFQHGPRFERWNPSLRLAIFGHTPKQNGEPYTIPQGLCIDSGAFFSGVLTAFNVTENRFAFFRK